MKKETMISIRNYALLLGVLSLIYPIISVGRHRFLEYGWSCIINQSITPFCITVGVICLIFALVMFFKGKKCSNE